MYWRYTEIGLHKKRYPLEGRLILIFVVTGFMLLLLIKNAETENFSYTNKRMLLANEHSLKEAFAVEVKKTADTNFKQIQLNTDVKTNMTFFPIEQQSQKILHLTFDDGPSKDTTPIILDILRERRVKATFFLVGENVRQNPELARRIVEDGHAVAIHTDSHAYQKIYASIDSFIDDFTKASQSIEEATGVRAKIFRFPGGSVNDFNRWLYNDIIKEMTNRGYIYYDWNASLEDTMGTKTKEALLKSAIETAAGHERVVMLAHDTEPVTAQSLPGLLDLFKDYRLEILTPDDEPIQF